MIFPILVINDYTANDGPITNVHSMTPPANENDPASVFVELDSVLEKLTSDISKALVFEMGQRMNVLAQVTNLSAQEIAYCNVRAAARFFVASTEMIQSPQDLKLLMGEFESLYIDLVKKERK